MQNEKFMVGDKMFLNPYRSDFMSHHQLINVPTAAAQAFLLDYT
jgi:hypothetical protein